MAVDIFLKLSNNIKGESQDSTHRNEIDVLAWDWALTQSGTTHLGSGGGGGKGRNQVERIAVFVSAGFHRTTGDKYSRDI